MLKAPVNRDEVRAIKGALREVMKGRVESGVLPYGGQWISAAELERKLVDERGRARVHAFELGGLLIALGLGSIALILLLWVLCY